MVHTFILMHFCRAARLLSTFPSVEPGDPRQMHFDALIELNETESLPKRGVATQKKPNATANFKFGTGFFRFFSVFFGFFRFFHFGQF